MSGEVNADLSSTNDVLKKTQKATPVEAKPEPKESPSEHMKPPMPWFRVSLHSELIIIQGTLFPRFLLAREVLARN